MKLDKNVIAAHNESLASKHKKKLANFLEENEGADANIQKLRDFQIAIPSWALGTGGTRFGRFSGGG
ncbi:MAG TPA: sugar isomerase, partial [Pelobium sp.]|nr:sugar isomerase [Pelobium sp.]